LHLIRNILQAVPACTITIQMQRAQGCPCSDKVLHLIQIILQAVPACTITIQMQRSQGCPCSDEVAPHPKYLAGCACLYNYNSDAACSRLPLFG
jgi:hypothetical protein